MNWTDRRDSPPIPNHEQALRAALGDGASTDALLNGWAESQAAASIGALFFLEPSFVAMAAREAGLDSALADAMIAAAGRISGDPMARALAWHVYHHLFHAADFHADQVRRWPVPAALLGKDAGLLYPLALCGALPEARALHRAHGVPDPVTRDTLRDMQRWASHYRRHHGAWGIAPTHLPWLRLHLHGELYDLGRLQFQPTRWAMPARVFRHATSGRVTALSEDGVRYGADGQRAGADGAHDPGGSWTARLELDTDWVIGHRITPRGMARREVTRLARTEWFDALAPGDPVLDLHIPRGATLDLEACRRSLEEAPRFFTAHFPERPFAAFACHSWLLDAQLEDLLPPSANLVRFQRQMYLVPIVGNQADALDWVFDGVPADLEAAPRDTSLRRAVLDHLRLGGRLRGGGGFLFLEDLPAWGTDIYRRPS